MTPVEALIKELGIQYHVIDDEAFASCPYHSPDRHPSWSVNLKSGVHYCFSCGASGNLSSLVAYIRGIAYTEATIYVNEKVGPARIYSWREDYDNISFSPMALKVSPVDMALFTDPPQEMLESKNITLDAARQYNIKWNPEHQTWICPYHDPYTNELWGWQEKNARIFRNYPASTRKSRTLFGLPNFINGSTAILVESPLDCAVIASAGIAGGVSTFGIPKGSYQLSLIQQRTDRIVLAFDNDTAGSRATRDAAGLAAEMFPHLAIYNYGTSDAKDPGEQAYDEIQFGIDHAWSYLEWRMID